MWVQSLSLEDTLEEEVGRYPGRGSGNPLQYSCLENPMDRGARRAIVHKVTKRQAQLKTCMSPEEIKYKRR